MPMFSGRVTIGRRCGRERRVFHDDAFGERDAGERAELRVAAFDQLREARRCQTRGNRIGLRLDETG